MSEMIESMLPDESTWENLSNEELRAHLASAKRSANAMLSRFQERDTENKRLHIERSKLATENERLHRTMKSVQDDARAMEEQKDNAVMLLAAYRNLVAEAVADRSLVALRVFDEAVTRAERITVWDATDMKTLAKELITGSKEVEAAVFLEELAKETDTLVSALTEEVEEKAPEKEVRAPVPKKKPLVMKRAKSRPKARKKD